MQIVSEVMTRNVEFIRPQESLQRAAQMMDELNIGALPVCDGERLVGMITDRDITVRSTSTGQSPQEARVEQVMSSEVRWCFEDQPLDEVMQQMSEAQIRRVPVVSHDDAHKLVGIVALGDVATKSGKAQKREAEQTMERISSPSEPDRSRRSSGRIDAGNAGTTATTRGAGSDTGTASGFAGSEMTDMGAGSGEAISTAGSASTANAAGAAGSAGPTGAERSDAGVEGIDAAGTSGASGGVASTDGSAGSGMHGDAGGKGRRR